MTVPRSVKALASAAALLLVATHVHAQTPTLVYGTNFDTTNTGTSYNDPTAYTVYNATNGGPELSGQGTATTATPLAWLSNDEADATDTNGNFAGGANGVFTSSQFSGNTGQLYGELANGYPGHSTVYLGRKFTLGTGAAKTTLTFNTDFTITKSTNGFNDSFGFTFLTGSTTGANGTPLLSVTFAPETGKINTQAVAQISIAGSTPTTTTANAALLLGQVSHLTISVNSVTDNVTVVEDGVSLFNVTNISLAGILSTTAIAATLDVTNTTTDTSGGAYVDAGDNGLIFDNYIVSQVPEPSTYAMMGLGTMALIGALRIRRKQA